MKIIIGLAILAVLTLTVSACSKRERSRNLGNSDKSDELKNLPDELVVTHTPNPVKAEREGRSGQIFTWLHSTTVSSPHSDVEIVEFGAFGWHGGKWVLSTIYNRPFNREEFAEWYDAPDAKIQKGGSATDPNNYTGGDELVYNKSRWYFIGKKSDGSLVKGEAIVEHLAEER